VEIWQQLNSIILKQHEKMEHQRVVRAAEVNGECRRQRDLQRQRQGTGCESGSDDDDPANLEEFRCMRAA
jgi:hypothetical protein